MVQILALLILKTNGINYSSIYWYTYLFVGVS